MEKLELQKKLDELKYFESQIARQDLSGKMFYCEGCMCRDIYSRTCNATQGYRESTCQCAYMELERKAREEKKNNTLVIEPRFSKPKTSGRKKKTVPDKQDDFVDASVYALFDTTKSEYEAKKYRKN